MFEAGKRYDVQVVSTALGEAGAKKTEQVVVLLQNAEGDTITAYLYLTPDAFPSTEKKLKALSWDAEEHGFRYEELNAEPSPIKGRKVTITTVAETYNGETKIKVKSIFPAGELRRMPEQEAAALAARVRAKLQQGANSHGDAAGAPGAEEGDEIPF